MAQKSHLPISQAAPLWSMSRQRQSTTDRRGDEGKNEMARESDRKIENSVDTPHIDNYSPNYIAESVNGYDDDMDEDYHGRQRDWS